MHCRIDFPPGARIYILEKLAAIEGRLIFGATETVQVAALVAAFQRVKVMAAATVEESE